MVVNEVRKMCGVFLDVFVDLFTLFSLAPPPFVSLARSSFVEFRLFNGFEYNGRKKPQRFESIPHFSLDPHSIHREHHWSLRSFGVPWFKKTRRCIEHQKIGGISGKVRFGDIVESWGVLIIFSFSSFTIIQLLFYNYHHQSHSISHSISLKSQLPRRSIAGTIRLMIPSFPNFCTAAITPPPPVWCCIFYWGRNLTLRFTLKPKMVRRRTSTWTWVHVFTFDCTCCDLFVTCLWLVCDLFVACLWLVFVTCL